MGARSKPTAKRGGNKKSGSKKLDTAFDDLLDATDEISIPRIDEAAGVTRPSNLGDSYVEDEYAELADEQLALWPAEADQDTRGATTTTAREQHQADAAVSSSEGRRADSATARDQYQHAVSVLAPLIRRSSHDYIRYWLVWLLLGLGDIVGIWGAAILLGENPLLALGQAIATGMAAVTAGAVGAELRIHAAAVARQRAELSEDEKRYRQLFEGGKRGRFGTVIISAVALLVVALVTGAVFALRASVEGNLSGMVFGLLAGATALSSYLNSYMHADEVADLLANFQARYERSVKLYGMASQAGVIKERDAAVAEAESIRQEYGWRGMAAGHRVMALKNRVLRRNPQVFGHARPTKSVARLVPIRGNDGRAA